MSKGFISVALIVLGIGLGILGWAQSESVWVAEIRPVSKGIAVANAWIWGCGVPGAVLIVVGLALVATGWGKKQ